MVDELEKVSGKIIAVFTKADVDGTGYIPRDVLTRVLSRLSPVLQKDTLDSFLNAIGFEENMPVSYASFVSSLFDMPLCNKLSKCTRDQGGEQMDHQMCGEVFVHGCGDCDQLGLGSVYRERRKPTRLRVLSGVRVVSIACGGLHSICTTVEGRLYSWGCGDDGALGRPSGEEDCEPRLVQLPTDVCCRMVACGDSHSCMVDLHGYVWTWGSYKDGSGYIGVAMSNGQITDKSWLPVRAPGLNEVVGIASGSNHTIALRSNEQAFVWGSNQNGQLGLQSGRGCEFVVEVLSGPDAANMTFFDREGGGVVAWREELPGTIHHIISICSCHDSEIDTLGVSATDIQHHIASGASIKTLANRKVLLEEKASLMLPQKVELHVGISNVYASSECTFVKTVGDSCYGCGLNSSGQVGLGSSSPVVFCLQEIHGLSGVTWIGGGMHMSAALANGNVLTWGRAEECGHGLGTGSAPVLSPRRVSSLPPIRSLRCGMSHTLACCDQGCVYVWGCGMMHQLGNCPRNYWDRYEDDREPDDEYLPYAISSKRFDGRTVLMADGGAQHTVELVWDEGRSEQIDSDTDAEECVAKAGYSIPECAEVTAGKYGHGDNSEDVIVVTTSEDFWRVQVEAVYRRRNPHKMANVPDLLKKYEGREAVLYTKVCKRYDLNPTKFYADPEAWADEEHDVKPDITPIVDAHELSQLGSVGSFNMAVGSCEPFSTASVTESGEMLSTNRENIFQNGSPQNIQLRIEPTLFQFGSSSAKDCNPDRRVEDSDEGSNDGGKHVNINKVKRKKPRVVQNSTCVKSKRKHRS